MKRALAIVLALLLAGCGNAEDLRAKPEPKSVAKPQPNAVPSLQCEPPGASVSGLRRLEDQYVWQVAMKMAQHQQSVRNVTTGSGTVMLCLVISRDGRLVDVGLARSSGSSDLDQATISMARAAAPYPPMPEELGGQHAFSLPLYFKRAD